MSKLTLSIDKDLIAAAKHEAAKRDTSLSQLVSMYFQALTAKESARVQEEDLPPATRALSGMLKGAEVDLEARIDHLEKKHS